ncbi:protein of unknown function (plasmid) [Cupriavidus taiwanensis]|uniref:Uncharacterized protein n=1 Tax=Cupriavidus taiwanensis TaxID=164546 RepID=A0A375IK38_9BURK|nr:hypothetical protein CT19425_U350080 [Cupriavidus taiwanensis]SPK74917.1 protein of unknown function [Cupriavidus taiwanensis]
MNHPLPNLKLQCALNPATTPGAPYGKRQQAVLGGAPLSAPPRRSAAGRATHRRRWSPSMAWRAPPVSRRSSTRTKATASG